MLVDHISLYCGLYTVLANCAKCGETAREMRTVRTLHLSLPRVLLGEDQVEATNDTKTKEVAVMELNEVSLRVTVKV